MRTLSLNPTEINELHEAAEVHPKAHVRMKAKALLDVNMGMAVPFVACYLVLPSRRPETIHRWIDRYLREGIAGLEIKPGRGRTRVR